MRTVQEQWESYRDSVIPKNASAIQVQECRRAFYAGAYASLDLFTSIGEPGISEDAGIALIEGLRSELEDFAGGVGAIRATHLQPGRG